MKILSYSSYQVLNEIRIKIARIAENLFLLFLLES